jgi:hypothetical protein
MQHERPPKPVESGATTRQGMSIADAEILPNV